MKTSNRRTGFKHVSTFLLVLGMALVCGPATGQDVGDEQKKEEMEFMLEDIVVTGSRIVRRDFEAVSPIVTVDETLFDQSATLAIETQLNKLPQFTPTLDVPTTGGDIQPTARNTPGEATVALRGLGANRNLVLINGRRGTPSNGMGVLDINTIPVAAIERVEAITGGASSTYGADAIAGVVNFIMKDDFVGLELDVQSGITEEGDNFEYQVSGILGADIADGRGNVSMAFSYNDRDDAMQKDRDFYREYWADPSKGGTQFFNRFTGFYLGNNYDGYNMPSASVLNEVMEVDGWTDPAWFISVYDDGNGNAFSGFNSYAAAGIPAAEAAGVIDDYNVILQNNGVLGYNNTESYLILPMERYNLYTQGDYEINDWIGAFFQGYFSDVNTDTSQEPGPITSGWSVWIYPEYNREVIPEEMLAILDSRADPDGAASLQAILPVTRETHATTTTYNLTAGLEGEIPGIDWTWEVFTSHGEAQTFTQSTGYASLERTRIVMSGVIDYADDGTPIFYDGYKNFGEGFEMTANTLNSRDAGFGGATATCTSGLNPFDWSSVTEDCWEAIKADVKDYMLFEQDIFEGNAQGRIADLPAGEMKGALGASHRENSFTFLSDTINSEGVSFNDTILGLYPAQDSEGSLEVDETYAELLVPVLKDVPGFKQLNLELGARRSDYDTTGASETYKALADWRIVDWLRFRGGYNRAERAPNIAELYMNPEMTFGYYTGGDPCSTLNVLPYSANPDANANYYDVITLCGQLMERTGNANADDEYYGADYRVIREDPSLATDQPTATFGFLWPLAVGNPDIRPETADTWTAGVVIDSPFDHPALSDWRVSIDYYTIEVTDAIGQQSGGIVMQQCVDPLFNPTYDPNSPYCDGFNRDARYGGVGQIYLSFFNNGAFETSGIDFQINWGMDAGPGRVMVNTVVNWLLDMSSTEMVGVNPMVDYTGTFGPGQNGLGSAAYEYRALTNVSYTYEDLTLTLRWQFYDSIEQATAAMGLASSTGAPKYHLFDLLANYMVTDNLWVRGGVENILNKEPPLVGVDPESTTGMYGGSYMATYYDTVGRRFYLGARLNFK